jgi:SGNH hydrolase-like domain, acetyltransferase AlgX
MKTRTKKGLLVFGFIILWLPYLNHRLEIIDSGKLQGYFTNAPDDTFTVNGWFEGTYQTKVNNYYNDHIGFRPDLLRLNSQIDFTLFRKLAYGGTTLGSDGYLFYDNYIQAYKGWDYVGYDSLHTRMAKLKRIQDTLAHLGKSLIMVYAPCKAWYCSERLPYSLAPYGKHNNYKTDFRIGDSLGINQVDFNSWFLAMKDTTREILYSRQGIHWTNYGAILAGDSLAKYIEHLRHIKMAHPKWTKVVRTTEPSIPDNDMAGILNLIFKIKSDTFCYPELFYAPDSGITKPKCVYIGDSYVINLLRMRVVQNEDSDWQFWFYFRHILNDTNHDREWQTSVLKEHDWVAEVKKSDCVILIYTPMNAAFIGNGFVEQLYDYYFPDKSL